MSDIPRRTRYEVLRRDGYTCRYCGAKAPDVKLNVDAVVPDVLGGSHKDPANLVTACEACNGGKSSSAPDAPLVAEVNDRALEWAQAMRAAQAKMLADIAARERDREQFRQWWDGWQYVEGDKRVGIPKDPTWWVTVDQLLSAGLPLVVIQDCINIAMTRKQIKDENRFRYMCGVAWSKVKELREAALAVTSGTESPEDDTDPIADGRLELADELLGDISEEERTYFLEAADMRPWQDDDDEPQTESQRACEAVSYALSSARSNLDWLAGRVRETIKGLPPEISERCLAEVHVSPTVQDPLSRSAGEAVDLLYALEDLIDLADASAWAAELSDGERSEWLDYAHTLWDRAKLSDDRWLVRAWTCAKVIASDQYYPAMCQGRGMHIPDCPALGTHYAVIAELKCCGPGRAEDHPGHLVCEHHLEQLMGGTFHGRSGGTFSATDFTEIPQPEAVPF